MGELSPGMKVAKMLDTNKDGVIDKPEMRQAPEKATAQLELSGFKLVDKLKYMDPKNSLPTLDQAAAYFEKVLEARRTGMPIEDELAKQRKVHEEEEDYELDPEDRRNEEYEAFIASIDSDDDGLISKGEFGVFQDKLVRLYRDDPAMAKLASSKDQLYKMLDRNTDGQVTLKEVRNFFDMAKNMGQVKGRSHSEL